MQDALARATKHIDTSLNLIGGRLGLDHDQVFFGRFGVPVMVRYLDQRQQANSGRWARRSATSCCSGSCRRRCGGASRAPRSRSSTRTWRRWKVADGGLDKLLEQLRLWHGGLRAEPGHFTGWSLGARFYPVLYLLTRMGEARDWGTGLPLKANLLGKMSRWRCTTSSRRRSSTSASTRAPK